MTEPTKYEYHVVSVANLQDVKEELEKRTAVGWEFVTAYGEITNRFFRPSGHVLIFRRAKT
jgi:hypothetical protein